MRDFKEKVAIVTGGARDIGRECSLKLAENGASVCINYFDKKEQAEETKKMIEDGGGKAIIVQGDMTKQDDVDKLVAECKKSFGDKIDVLVNVAGGALHTPHIFSEIDEVAWDKVVDINLKGTFLCCQVLVDQFRKQGQGGKIVNISALAGRWLGSLAGCHYTAAKAGVIGLTRHLAHELGPEGIFVNSIAPTITLASERTVNLWNSRPNEYKEKVISQIPLRRLSTPEEVAAGVIFLCTDEASYMTGVTLDSNGGRFFSQQMTKS